MSLQVKVPTVGESITEVTIASWLKQEGDYVEMDEVLCELESDKATFELNAESSGILKIKAQEGDTLAIGDLICEIDSDGKAEAASSESITPEVGTAPDKAPTGPTTTGEIHEMKVPEVGESITEVTISAWLKQSGDFVELDEVIAEIDSDKATFDLPAEASGILEVVAKDGNTLQIGDLICKIQVTEGGKPAEVTNHSASPRMTV